MWTSILVWSLFYPHRFGRLWCLNMTLDPRIAWWGSRALCVSRVHWLFWTWLWPRDLDWCLPISLQHGSIYLFSLRRPLWACSREFRVAGSYNVVSQNSSRWHSFSSSSSSAHPSVAIIFPHLATSTQQIFYSLLLTLHLKHSLWITSCTTAFPISFQWTYLLFLECRQNPKNASNVSCFSMLAWKHFGNKSCKLLKSDCSKQEWCICCCINKLNFSSNTWQTK